nr:HAD family hydrolase [Mycobacterium tilburgii]
MTDQLRKGAANSVSEWVRSHVGTVPTELGEIVDGISAAGGTPLMVGQVDGDDGSASARVLGVIHLKDVVKQGMRERFDAMRLMGIRAVMVTVDNPLTAKAIDRRGQGGRLPRLGHARRQDDTDQEGAAGRTPGGDNR